MNDINITFENQYTAGELGQGESYSVHCDQLPTRHECRIVEQPRLESPAAWYLHTATRSPTSRRRGLTRKHCVFESLDAAKAAAVAYVEARVAEAKRQEPVRHGPGQYRKGNRGWYVQYDGSACWHPAGTKERAIRLLDIRTPSEWAVADIHRS